MFYPVVWRQVRSLDDGLKEKRKRIGFGAPFGNTVFSAPKSPLDIGEAL